MRARLFQLKCLTNLHVGSGETNFNIIDNEVERDVVTGFPTIHSSGVKGAFRAFFKQILKDQKTKGEGPGLVSEQVIADIFGKSDGDTTAGKLRFLSANLLAQPIRTVKGDKAYELVSPASALSRFQADCELYVNGQVNTTGAFGRELTDQDYHSYELPVMARNSLEEGKENLWYEEVVPHQTLFYVVVLASGADSEDLLATFESVVANQVVQFGGNASIGYGLCQVTTLGGGKNG